MNLVESLDFKLSKSKAWLLLKKLYPNSHKIKSKLLYINPETLMKYLIVSTKPPECPCTAPLRRHSIIIFKYLHPVHENIR